VRTRRSRRSSSTASGTATVKVLMSVLGVGVLDDSLTRSPFHHPRCPANVDEDLSDERCAHPGPRCGTATQRARSDQRSGDRPIEFLMLDESPAKLARRRQPVLDVVREEHATCSGTEHFRIVDSRRRETLIR
jgi:hypothetical protein